MGETKSGGKDFQNERGGNPTFQVKFRDKKRSKMGTFRENLAQISIKFFYILCIQYLSDIKKCFYSDIYIHDNNFSNLAQKVS